MLGSRLWDRHRDAKRQREAAAAAEATAQQLSSSLQQQQQEGIDVEILQAFLDGASWADSLDQFFTGNCPAFSSFVVGGEYALQQTELHMKFVSTAEALLDSKLKQMAVSADDFLARVLRDIAEAGPGSASAAASTAVMQRLEECADFERFGEMMRQRYEDTMQDSGGGKGSGEEADGDAAEEQEDAAAAVAAVGAAGGGAEEDFAREQREIREAMARRKSAREQATQRAAAAAAELDAADAAADHADEAAGAEEGVHGASSLEPELTGPWEMGSVHRGVVTFWENGQRSWGAKVGGYGMILKMGKPEVRPALLVGRTGAGGDNGIDDNKN
jgi:hypothetical protein